MDILGTTRLLFTRKIKKKSAFVTPWGTFMYDWMLFVLMNVGDTFQRAMDIAFVGEKGKFIVIYLDDITIFSKSYEENLKHLKQTFLKKKLVFLLILNNQILQCRKASCWVI